MCHDLIDGMENAVLTAICKVRIVTDINDYEINTKHEMRI